MNTETNSWIVLEQQLAAMAESGAFEWLQERSKPFLKLMGYYKCAMMEIETKFNVLNEEYAFEFDRNPITSIKTRLKRFVSIRDKMEQKSLPRTLEAMEENLNDIAGVRVICSFPEDVYTLAEAFLKQDDVTLIQKKDYIANPKPNGYRSLHLIVKIPVFLSNERREMKVEVQLRTIAMDFWASLEHDLKYKPVSEVQGIDSYDELKDCSRIIEDVESRMQILARALEMED